MFCMAYPEFVLFLSSLGEDFHDGHHPKIPAPSLAPVQRPEAGRPSTTFDAARLLLPSTAALHHRFQSDPRIVRLWAAGIWSTSIDLSLVCPEIQRSTPYSVPYLDKFVGIKQCEWPTCTGRNPATPNGSKPSIASIWRAVSCPAR
ncbi:hypothetical protein CLAIMM_09576 isoform 2 [Cladophialophora immunda]|nr:hypothetical protein CLAIMM_09576 isoform 1 [Cladophialophora immunda]OQV04732.1 hypothetical protein CLAIMM_09576 isoform 2 [Cladophialophora immunda]